MNKFALGVLTTLVVTTKEGRDAFDKATKIMVKAGNKVAKDKLGIDFKEILSEEDVKKEEKIDGED